MYQSGLYYHATYFYKWNFISFQKSHTPLFTYCLCCFLSTMQWVIAKETIHPRRSKVFTSRIVKKIDDWPQIKLCSHIQISLTAPIIFFRAIYSRIQCRIFHWLTCHFSLVFSCVCFDIVSSKVYKPGLL